MLDSLRTVASLGGKGGRTLMKV